MATQSSPLIGDRERRALRIVVVLCSFLGIAVIGGVFVYFVARDIVHAEPWMMVQFRAHPAAVLGLPCGALAAFAIVLLLATKSGRIEFEGFGLKFRGASGEIILWVVCFSAIVGAIKLLW